MHGEKRYPGPGPVYIIAAILFWAFVGLAVAQAVAADPAGVTRFSWTNAAEYENGEPIQDEDRLGTVLMDTRYGTLTPQMFVEDFPGHFAPWPETSIEVPRTCRRTTWVAYTVVRPDPFDDDDPTTLLVSAPSNPVTPPVAEVGCVPKPPTDLRY